MRINTTLQVSRLQKWSEALLLLLVCLILIFSDMPPWGKGLALLLLAFVLIYQHFFRQPSARLVQLIQFDKDTWRWSILEPHQRKKNTTFDGRLVSVHRGLVVIVLQLEAIEKNKPVTQNWVVWRDQVDADNWRRLIVIARFWAEDVKRIMD